jgi:hypothetical protein
MKSKHQKHQKHHLGALVAVAFIGETATHRSRADTPLFPFPDRLPSVFSTLCEKVVLVVFWWGARTLSPNKLKQITRDRSNQNILALATEDLDLGQNYNMARVINPFLKNGFYAD